MKPLTRQPALIAHPAHRLIPARLRMRFKFGMRAAHADECKTCRREAIECRQDRTCRPRQGSTMARCTEMDNLDARSPIKMALVGERQAPERIKAGDFARPGVAAKTIGENLRGAYDQ